MKFIDMHTHVYPDAIAAKAARSIRNYYHLGDDMDGTIATLLERGSAVGVDHYLILPVAVKPDHVRSINRFTLEQTKEHAWFTGFAGEGDDCIVISVVLEGAGTGSQQAAPVAAAVFEEYFSR